MRKVRRLVGSNIKDGTLTVHPTKLVSIATARSDASKVKPRVQRVASPHCVGIDHRRKVEFSQVVPILPL